MAVARELSTLGDEVTLMGSGSPNSDEPYDFIHVPAVPRERFERWPKLPALRSQEAWEDATFAAGLLLKYRPQDFDVTVTCAYPFTQWALRRPALGKKPKHVFVTQNGDWPAYSDNAEFRLFNCDGLVCINPDYFERNRKRFRSKLIPNGVDTNRFAPGTSERSRLGLPEGVPIILMVSALIASKNVSEGIEAVSRLSDAHLVVAGDGPLRDQLREQAEQQLPGRYHQITIPAVEMPALYRSADVFMHLSRDESFGNVYVEALACGLPIVAYESTRTRWIVGDDMPLAPENPEGLSAALQAALTRKTSDTDRNQERAKLFDWSLIGQQYQEFFRELVL